MNPTNNFAEYLAEFVSDDRKRRIEEILNLRTRYITVVLEDIFQPHNSGAVLRSADAFGVQDVHIIENRNEFQPSSVDIGASKWLTLTRYNQEFGNTEKCIEQLKNNGYKIYATVPREGGFTPENIPVESKMALLLGAEVTGLSQTAQDLADGFINIPMRGFSESLNLSVCAAVLMQRLTVRMQQSGCEWQLSEKEKSELQLEYYKQSVRGADIMEEEFFKTKII